MDRGRITYIEGERMIIYRPEKMQGGERVSCKPDEAKWFTEMPQAALMTLHFEDGTFSQFEVDENVWQTLGFWADADQRSAADFHKAEHLLEDWLLEHCKEIHWLARCQIGSPVRFGTPLDPYPYHSQFRVQFERGSVPSFEHKLADCANDTELHQEIVKLQKETGEDV
jgi:hypothetical protein